MSPLLCQSFKPRQNGAFVGRNKWWKRLKKYLKCKSKIKLGFPSFYLKPFILLALRPHDPLPCVLCELALFLTAYFQYVSKVCLSFLSSAGPCNLQPPHTTLHNVCCGLEWMSAQHLLRTERVLHRCPWRAGLNAQFQLFADIRFLYSWLFTL